MSIVIEASKLLAKETLGVDLKVDLTKAAFLVLKQQIKNYGRLCKL